MPSLTKVQTGFIEPQGPLELTAGTQQAPSLFFSGSTTTGWYSPAANQLAVSANGAETVRIRDNGFVGIGTTNPISNLHVVTNTVQYGYLVRGQNRGTGSIENLLQTDKGICVWGLNSNLGGAMLDTAGAGDLIFNVRTGGNVVFSADIQYQEQHLVIIESGNVGIGLTNPSAKLDVSGSIQTSAALRAYSTGGGRYYYLRGDSSSDFAAIGARTSTDTVNTDIICWNTSNVGIGITNPGTRLAVNGFITENPGDGTYWNVVTQKDIGYGSNQVPLNQYLGQLAFIDQYSPSGLRRDGGGSDDVFVNSSGNVGIGLTEPLSRLHVIGQIFTATGGKSGSNTYLSLQSTDATNKMELQFGNLTNTAWQIQAVENGVAYRHLVLNPVGGNVGIGTTNPTQKFHSSGSALIDNGGYLNDNGLTINKPHSLGLTNGVLVRTDANYNESAEYLTAAVKLVAPGGYAVGISTNASATGVGGSQNAWISFSGGAYFASNVGIATANPLARLSIGNGSINDVNVPVQISAPASGLIYYGANNNGGYGALFGFDSSLGGGVVRTVGASVGLSLIVNDQTRALTITSVANIGVGTTNPSTKLAVNGFITENPGDGTYWNVVTQKDIGYGSNQVPLNQYLGQLAFIDQYSPSGLRRDSGGSDDVFVDSNGNVGVATTTPTTIFDVNGNSIRVRSARTPASATAAGNQGEICWDASYIYICTATNTWRRVAISAW